MSDFTLRQRIQEVKEKYHIRDVARQIMGDRLAYSRAGYDQYHSPFRADLHPSFTVWENGICTDHSGYPINGKEYGDVIDLVAEYYGVSVRQALNIIDGNFKPVAPNRKAYKPPKAIHTTLTMRDVQRGLRLKHEAIRYFTQRCLREQTVEERYLGAMMWPHSISVDGEEHRYNAKRYSIPNIANGVVREVKLRLDYDDARKTFQLLDEKLVDKVRLQLAQRSGRHPDLITEENLIEAFFGGRYTKMKGGHRGNLIFNLERLIRKDEDGNMIFFKWKYMLLHEGEVKAYAMEDACDDREYGYPSISGHGPDGLAKALVNVEKLYIVQDNDPDRTDARGRTINPGKQYAERALLLSGRTLGKDAFIISPPDGLNGADDVIKAGIVHEWMSRYGLEPLRIRRTA